MLMITAEQALERMAPLMEDLHTDRAVPVLDFSWVGTTLYQAVVEGV